MQSDEFQAHQADTNCAALDTNEISALLKASGVQSFTPSEKVKQAPINFQKKTLAELAQLSCNNEFLDQSQEQSVEASEPAPELCINDDNLDKPSEDAIEVVVEDGDVDEQQTRNESNLTLDSSVTSKHDDLHLKLNNQVAELEAYVLKLEAELTELKSTTAVAEDDGVALKQFLTKLPPLAETEEERFTQKVLSTIEDVIRTRLGDEISEHPATFVSKLKEKIKDLFVEGSCVLIELNAEDLEAIQRALKNIELGQHVTLKASDKLGHGDLIIKAGTIEINDSLQVGLVEAEPEKSHD